MIPAPALAAWRARVPWRDDRQVEQDLLLSALAMQVAREPFLGERLAWRGGTCLHKLHLGTPRRYSEDLDYISVGDTPSREIGQALQEVARTVGLTPGRYQLSPSRVNLWCEAPATAGGSPIRIKFEVNCSDIPPRFDLIRLHHQVTGRWGAGHADILTFVPAELVGTKFRALAQRRKGRDLFDLWLARRELGIVDGDLARAAAHYMKHENIAPGDLRERITLHARAPEFVADLDVLATAVPPDYSVTAAVRELIQWTDRHLDPILDSDRSEGARRRDAKKREAQPGWGPGRVRCTAYAESNGSWLRCEQWLQDGEVCQAHAVQQV